MKRAWQENVDAALAAVGLTVAVGLIAMGSAHTQEATRRGNVNRPDLVLAAGLLEERITRDGAVTVRLTLENRGTRAARVILPWRATILGRFGSHGCYDMEVRGPDGKSLFVPLPGVRGPTPALDIEDTAIIPPGASVGYLVKLDDKRTLPELNAKKGRYRIVASYMPRAGSFGRNAGKLGSPRLWEGKVESNVIEYTIGDD